MKCENCGNEHDGSYGNGRFCSKHCRYVWIGKESNITMKRRGTKRNNLSKSGYRKRSPFGTWKCEKCQIVFETKHELQYHNHENHPIPKGTSWNKGLTKETDVRVLKFSQILKNEYRSGRLKPSNLGKRHTKEQNKKISESMKKYYSEHTELSPYKLHHSSKESYPEKYFNKLLINEGIINFKREFPIKRYSLDFAFENNKIDLEIDGSQHYTDSRIVQHDIERTQNLEKEGWKVIRVRWDEWKKKTLEEKREWIENFKKIVCF